MEREDIYIVTADLAGPPFDTIREKYPQRFVSVGIAEQNLISVSAGLALAGKRVIAYGPEPFIISRALDQIRNGICAMHVPVTIVGLGTGLNNAEYGATHFVTEDVAIMGLCPGISQITVNDEDICEAAFTYMLHCDSPLYLRLDRICGGHLDAASSVSIQNGFRMLQQSNSKICIVAEGYPVHQISSMDWGYEGPNVLEVFAHPFDEAALLDALRKMDQIVVCEEQQRRSGLGTVLLELFNDSHITKRVIRMGVDYQGSYPGTYGPREYWIRHYGFDTDALRECVLSLEGRIQ